MEISKRSIITRSNVEVSTVIIHFESFKPVPLYHKESNYFNILKPLINEIFGLEFNPIYSPNSKTTDLKNSFEVSHNHLGFPRVLSWLQKKNLLLQIQVFSSYYPKN